MAERLSGPRGQRSTDAFSQAFAELEAQRPLRKPLQRIAEALRSNRLDEADRELKSHLARRPDDADGVFLSAQLANRRNHGAEAASLFIRCLELVPDCLLARFAYAKLLARRHEYAKALIQAGNLLQTQRDNPLFLQLKAELLRATGEDESSLEILERLATDNSQRAESWITCGDALRAMGLQQASIAAYRKAVGCRPSFGLAWWSLANLKTFRFSDAEVDQMRNLVNQAATEADDRINLMFSLGKALEDRSAFGESFAWYARGNAARRLQVDYDWNAIGARLAADKEIFTSSFLERRNDAGCKVQGPIFILGRPRSGSTLVEQILASHSEIEATAELPYVADIAIRLEDAHGGELPQVLASLDPGSLALLGEEYLERTQIHRKSTRQFFIDKAPANYHQTGLILLALPNAKIIDVRRHPAANCFSMFKHNYIESNLRLAELGRVYRDYVSLMAHFDRVAPGRIHRVIYEQLVADPETEIRKLLDYLGLSFEQNCVRFHESNRTVRTPSSEQVRRPISGESVDHWRNFEPWLGPLLESLGTVLSDYPAVPSLLQ